MLTEKEMERIDKLNKKNEYGLSKAQHTRLMNEYKAAIENGDEHTVDLIEYRLVDMIFHSAVNLYDQGKLKEVLKKL